jgi:hypothetical protein
MITPDSAPKKLRGSLRVLCSCGWSTRVTEVWMAESAAKLHQKLGSTGTDHAVSIEGTR